MSFKGSSSSSNVCSDVIDFQPLIYLGECRAQQGGIAFARSGSRLIVGAGNRVHVIDIATGGSLRNFEAHGRVRCVAISSDGSAVLFGGFDKSVRTDAVASR